MKNFLLIDNDLLLKFRAKTMNITNYLQNRLSTKNQREELILKKAWIGKKYDFGYIKIFDNTINMLIFKEKRHKSDIYKNWKRIFIRYNNITQYM